MENDTLENSYKVKTVNFEGPFGLLLNLIEARKLFINEISLAQVTEDYINYVNNLGGLSSAEISSFIVVAATLILIKSKSLLPNLNLTNEEEGEIVNLEERLKLFELYSKLGLNIKRDFGKKIIFAPLERKNDTLIFLPDDQITRESMMTFANDVINKIPKKIILPEVEVRKVISIEEMIDKLAERMQTAIKMNFKEFTGKGVTKEERVVVIVGFLAMLELVRQGIVNVVQENNFQDIIIEQHSSDEVVSLAIE
ncbi:MAG: segregation/condensation protein A [Candidatus Nomurabacteria bacterium]|nr:segregation/condensation protein A [Candidatus Nomurabacteria bacterium]